MRQDWAFLVTRELADQALQHPFADYFGCRAAFNLSDGIEGWNAMHAFPGRAERWAVLNKLLAAEVGGGGALLPAFLTRQPDAARSTMCDCHKYNGLPGTTDGRMLNASALPWRDATASTSAWCRGLNDLNSCNVPAAL